MWFESIYPEEKDIYQKCKNFKIVSKGIGTVLRNRVREKNSINISNVSYIPQLRYNLLPVTASMKV